ncbi:MAG: thiolase domain-containing protein [Alcaligenaceae bacterium]|jgi:acetyl-CoA C-acetyltransferase|nr:thiolase domain-containing protein [Alcaligenaceae bacterium]
MTIKNKAYIIGAYEHPTRFAPDKSVAQLHAESALGALQDAGLELKDIDGYFCAGDVPGGSPISMAEYLNLNLSWLDGTEIGGCSYIAHVERAAQAITAGKCRVALITLAGKPKSTGVATGTATRILGPERPETPWDLPYKPTITGIYGMITQRHMHEYGTTAKQLAAIKVAASHHAQYNENALLKKVVTVEDVINSPIIAPPLHRLDCCVITDGGGALIVTTPEIAKSLKRPLIKVMGASHTIKTSHGGYIAPTETGALKTGPKTFAEAGVTPDDIKYASIYDNFTIMVLMQLEDLGFCKKGQAGHFVTEGNLISGTGKLPWNTDGGGLCNNHPSNRGGITKVIEAVRQLREEAHPAVQVKNCDIALAAGPGLVVGEGHAHATLILGRE